MSAIRELHLEELGQVAGGDDTLLLSGSSFDIRAISTDPTPVPWLVRLRTLIDPVTAPVGG